MGGRWAGFEYRHLRMIENLAQMGISQKVLEAMAKVPRHLFIEEALRSRAYDEISLPLGLGQTISQPYTVARMSELLISDGWYSNQKILEVGTGCGYQTAVLMALGFSEIYSIERLKPLQDRAKQHLRTSRLHGNVRMVCGDGYEGLPLIAPFDGIIITAAPFKKAPPLLLQQLAIGGKMVLPIIGENDIQHLWLIKKNAHGYIETQFQRANFVPLVGGT